MRPHLSEGYGAGTPGTSPCPPPPADKPPTTLNIDVCMLRGPPEATLIHHHDQSNQAIYSGFASLPTSEPHTYEVPPELDAGTHTDTYLHTHVHTYTHAPIRAHTHFAARSRRKIVKSGIGGRVRCFSCRAGVGGQQREQNTMKACNALQRPSAPHHKPPHLRDTRSPAAARPQPGTTTVPCSLYEGPVGAKGDHGEGSHAWAVREGWRGLVT